MRCLALFVAVLICLPLLPGCGSSSGDASEAGGADHTQPTVAPRTRRGSRDRGATEQQDPDPAGGSPQTPDASDEDGSERLANDLGEIIFALEHGATEDFIKDYINADVFYQVRVHDLTFPDRGSLQKMIDGFEQGVGPDLLRDLQVCQSLVPEIIPQEDGWYAAVYQDDALFADVVLAYDPAFRSSWFPIEVPLVTPWGDGLPTSQVWQEWREEVVGGPANSIRVERLGDFDPHMNPAAVLWGMQRAFMVERGRPRFDIRAYCELLTPDAQKIQASILIRRLYVHENARENRDAIFALLDQYRVQRGDLSSGFRWVSEDDNADFYLDFADRIPAEASLIDFIEEASALYKQLEGKDYHVAFPSGGDNPRPMFDGSSCYFAVQWGQSRRMNWNPPSMMTRFVEIDGRWYVESYWEAKRRADR